MKKLIGIFIILLMVLPTIGLAQEDKLDPLDPSIIDQIQTLFTWRHKVLVPYVKALAANGHKALAQEVVKHFNEEARTLSEFYLSKEVDVIPIIVDVSQSKMSEVLMEIDGYQTPDEPTVERVEDLRKKFLESFDSIDDYVDILMRSGLEELAYGILTYQFSEATDLTTIYRELKNNDHPWVRVDQEASEEEKNKAAEANQLHKALLNTFSSAYSVRTMVNEIIRNKGRKFGDLK